MDSRLFWLALAAFVGSTEGGLIAGLLPAISEDFGISIGQAGQVVLGYSLAYAIGTPLLAVVLGGIGRRRILAGSELTLAVCALLMAISPFFGWLVGARTLFAVAAGLFTGTALAVAAMLAAPGQRGRSLQIITIGQALAVLLGVPVGAYVAAQFGWRVPYFAITVAAAAAALVLMLRLPRGMLGDTQSMADRARVLRNPGVLPALLTTMLFMVGGYLPLIYVGAVMEEAGLGRNLLPLVLLANGVGSIAASLSAGRLADAMGNRRAVALSLLALIAALCGYAVLPHLPGQLQLPALLLGMAVLGYMGWGFWIAHCSQIAHLAPSSVPVAISLDLTALNIGIAIAAGIGGVIVDHYGAWALSFAGVPIALAGLVVWLRIPDGGRAH